MKTLRVVKTNQGFYVEGVDIDFFDLLLELKDIKYMFLTFKKLKRQTKQR